MTKLDATQIFRSCLNAGFTPDQAVTFTAISLAESGGETGSHATVGEDSVGIFQINRDAHDWAFNMDLTDPNQAAQAAFKVSGGGADISPWTVTHGGNDARYLQFRSTAQAAAAQMGYSGVQGYFGGVSGYGDHHAASLLNSADAFDIMGTGSSSSSGDVAAQLAHAPMGTLERFVGLALEQAGDKYVFGAEVDLNDPNPDKFDCSELVEWAAQQAGLPQLAGSNYLETSADYQYRVLKQHGGDMSVEDALHTRGALLFRFPYEPGPDGTPTGHVAISLGDGRTIEARGSAYGVVIVDAESNQGRFNFAARIPDLRAATAGELAQLGSSLGAAGSGLPGAVGAGGGPGGGGLAGALSAAAVVPAAPTMAELFSKAVGGDASDVDHDGLAAGLENLLGLHADQVDSDNDGLSDRYELFTSHTNPLSADSDNDGLGDSLESFAGRDARLADGTMGGRDFDLFLGNGPDTDNDGIADTIETALGLNVGANDTDGDGLTDAYELAHGLNPLKVDSKGDGMPDALRSVLNTDPLGGASHSGHDDVLASLTGGAGGAGHDAVLDAAAAAGSGTGTGKELADLLGGKDVIHHLEGFDLGLGH